MDTIFHCATAAPAAENLANKQMMQDVNVKGTQNILKAAVSEGVRKVVYTSSASVVFDGQDLIRVDESAPFVARPLDYYTGTKVKTSFMAKPDVGAVAMCHVSIPWWSAGQVASRRGHHAFISYSDLASPTSCGLLFSSSGVSFRHHHTHSQSNRYFFPAHSSQCS